MSNALSFRRLSEVDIFSKRVFIRSDLNVPIDESGVVLDETRVKASLEAIKYCLRMGAAVMVTSHLGRPPENSIANCYSLAPVVRIMNKLLGVPVRLVRDWITKSFSVSSREVVVLENCRLNPGERQNDLVLSKKMAELCDVYVNDAFGSAHRLEATTCGIAQFAPIACAGPLLTHELTVLDRMLQGPKRPLVAVVGGSKISTKLPVLEHLAEKVDALVLGGGIGNTFLLARGSKVGKSLVEPACIDAARSIAQKLCARGKVLRLPTDVVCAKEFTPTGGGTSVKSIGAVLDNEMILDWGPSSAEELIPLLNSAATIIWNGPLGVFEWELFAHATRVLAMGIAKASGFSIAGGGETLSAINKFGVAQDIDYISTGGGAFLSFLQGGTLPAIAVLQTAAQ